jgi:hypothetical protein
MMTDMPSIRICIATCPYLAKTGGTVSLIPVEKNALIANCLHQLPSTNTNVLSKEEEAC